MADRLRQNPDDVAIDEELDLDDDIPGALTDDDDEDDDLDLEDEE